MKILSVFGEQSNTIDRLFNEIRELKKENSALKAHAVEVLARELWNHDEYNKYATLDDARAEARALLGWDNDNNDKEKA